MKLTGAAILVPRGAKVLQAAPAAYPFRSDDRRGSTMEFQIACDCGKGLAVTEGMAGSSVPCTCGRVVRIPSLRVLKEQATLKPEVGVPAPHRSPVGETPGLSGELRAAKAAEDFRWL